MKEDVKKRKVDKTYEIRSVDGFVNGDEEDEWKMRYYTECDSLRRLRGSEC